MIELLLAAENITRHGAHYWEWENGEVVRIWVNYAIGGVQYPAPTAPAPPAVPVPIPYPSHLFELFITFLAISLVAGILVWWYGCRKGV